MRIFNKEYGVGEAYGWRNLWDEINSALWRREIWNHSFIIIYMWVFTMSWWTISFFNISLVLDFLLQNNRKWIFHFGISYLFWDYLLWHRKMSKTKSKAQRECTARGGVFFGSIKLQRLQSWKQKTGITDCWEKNQSLFEKSF